MGEGWVWHSLPKDVKCVECMVWRLSKKET